LGRGPPGRFHPRASRRGRPGRGWALAALLAALAPAPAARANGAFPDEFSIHFPAGAPHRILVGANFGLIVSEDDGATWRYACEPWVTEGSSAALSQANVNFYLLTADGAVIAQSIEVTRSDDDACTWPVSGGAITGQVVADMFPDPNDPTLVIAIIDVATGSYLIASHDGGKTFVDPPLYQTNALLTAVEISKTTPRVIYATSIGLSGSGSTLLRSDDSGMTWTPTVIPAPAGTQPLIMAIDPEDSNIVYLRVVGALNDSIVITPDGGGTFQTALSITGQFSSFLRAADGSLYAGTVAGTLYVRKAGDTDFTSHPSAHFRCLGQRPGTSRIFACGDMGLDGFSVGTSDDGGDTFQRMMNFIDILGPLTCAPVESNCQAHWARIQLVLGITHPDAGPPFDAGTPGPDAGTAPDGGLTPPPLPGTGAKSCSSTGVGTICLLGLIALLFAPRRMRS
jgi:hypothetical protein